MTLQPITPATCLLTFYHGVGFIVALTLLKLVSFLQVWHIAIRPRRIEFPWKAPSHNDFARAGSHRKTSGMHTMR